MRKARMAASYSAATSVRARSRYRARLFSSEWPLSNWSFGLIMPWRVRYVMIWCRNILTTVKSVPMAVGQKDEVCGSPR